MNRWFAGELLVIVRGIVAAAAPEALVAAVAASPVAVAVVMLCGEGARASADWRLHDRSLHDRSLWPPQDTARMHSRLGEQMPH